MALYWDGFMPKIVVSLLTTKAANQEYDASVRQGGVVFWKTRNGEILDVWFAANQDKFTLVADQLTKKLGEEKFKNMTLSNPTITWDELTIPEGTILTPKVTFTLTPKDGYTLADNSENTVTLTIRNLYKAADPNTNLFATQGASPSAAPGNTTEPNNATVIKNVNVYLNYTGPSIVLDEALPTVGGQENTSINGTSNVTGDFNNAFRGNPSSGLLFTNRYPNPLLKSVINYVNKFDPKFRAEFVTNATNGVTITKVQSGTQLRPGTLDDLNKNNVFLQQIKGDTEAVYFAVSAIASNGWLNTFLIRIPLTKFVRPISVLQTPDQQQTQEGGEEATQPQNAGSGTASTSEVQSGQSNGPVGSGTGSTQQAQSSSTTGTSSSSN
ncbi:hemagglutinin [Mycoplasmopsis synoviae]|uniref:hemagglutinin n=1 Tax=Mycoplasmopsis synoviae TaxID=2109 RepID=UPI002264F698|nr:hemagglutinin [Mycoplasmopsis synoviae]UZW64111.1 hemagglutinin [Mycoplasmopsis synoviae]